MTKANITQYSSTPSSNADINDINIAENCPASGLNNAIRELMAHLKNVDTGSQALTALSVAGSVTATTSLKTPLIEFTDGDNALTIADGGNVTANANLTVTGDLIASSLNGGQFGGRRNIIINGRMDFDQRNGGSEVVPASDAYTLDRFRYNASQASKLKVQQNAQADTPPEGFSNYLGVTVNATHTVASTDNFFLTYFVEGFDSAHLDFGKSTAKTVTLSFYVRSTLTGTFSGSIVNSAENRAYPYTYTISSADTWERKTITIAGDTSGTWIGATNGKGLMLTFSLGMGSNFTGTAGQWNGAQDFGATGETVKLVENASAEWKMTGLQLEVGSQATPFEHLSVGESLNLCQRYYFVHNPDGLQTYLYAGAYTAHTTTALHGVNFPTTMRSAPTVGSFTTSQLSGMTTNTEVGFCRFVCSATSNGSVAKITSAVSFDSEL